MNIKEYNELCDKLKPKVNILKNSIKAFLCGGVIGVIGQILLNIYMHIFNFTQKEATAPMIVSIVLIACILTGLGVYDKLGQKFGAGMFIPITGFANSICSAALDSKFEGLILGIGCNIFKYGGCVIFYGIVSTFIFGVIRYVFNI